MGSRGEITTGKSNISYAHKAALQADCWTFGRRLLLPILRPMWPSGCESHRVVLGMHVSQFPTIWRSWLTIQSNSLAASLAEIAPEASCSATSFVTLTAAATLLFVSF